MLRAKTQLSGAETTHDVRYGRDGQQRHIAYLDRGIWYHRVTTRGKVEFWPFNEQDDVRHWTAKRVDPDKNLDTA